PYSDSGDGLLHRLWHYANGRLSSLRGLQGFGLNGLCLGKTPSAIQNLRLRSIKANGIVPPLRGGEAVWCLAGTATELNGDRAVCALLCRQVIQSVDVEEVMLEKAFGVVHTDGPKSVDRNVLHRQLINRDAVVLIRRDIEIDSVLFGVPAPTHRRADQTSDGIDLSLVTESPF